MSGALAMKTLCDGPGALPLEVAGSREFVSVSVAGPKGSGTFRFHVDTGGNTPGLMIEKSAALGIGVNTEADLPKKIVIAGKPFDLPEGAGWVIADDTSDDPSKRAFTSKGNRKDFSVGQIGAGFLSRFVVCIDPSAGKLGLGKPADFAFGEAPIETGDPSISMLHLLILEGGANHAIYPFLHVVIRSNGEFVGGYGVLVDTGATTSMLDLIKLDYLHDKMPAWGFAKGTAGDSDMIGGGIEEEVIAAEGVALDSPKAWVKYENLQPVTPVDVGQVTFVSRATGTFGKMFGEVAPTMGTHGAIANDVLDRFRILLDYAGKRVFLQRIPTATAPASASMVRVGVSILFDPDGCPVVQRITSTNAPGVASALQIGDVITTIDGQDACKMMHHEISAALAGKLGESKKVGIRRRTKSSEVTVPVSDLLAPSPAKP
jgi:hypothetical protein